MNALCAPTLIPGRCKRQAVHSIRAQRVARGIGALPAEIAKPCKIKPALLGHPMACSLQFAERLPHHPVQLGACLGGSSVGADLDGPVRTPLALGALPRAALDEAIDATPQQRIAGGMGLVGVERFELDEVVPSPPFDRTFATCQILQSGFPDVFEMPIGVAVATERSDLDGPAGIRGQ